MKLKNKKTGEIVVFGEGIVDLRKLGCANVAEMIEAGWEDYREPKEYWCIDWAGGVNHLTVLDDVDKYEKDKKQIGNYFGTEKEAEKAVEKLKALANLHKNGFRFIKWKGANPLDELHYRFIIEAEAEGAAIDDLDLLFGGEE